MALQSRYVDPDTGHYVIENGNYKRCSSALVSVYELIMAHNGSIPGSTVHHSLVHTISHVVPGAASDLESYIDEVLLPHQGRLFKSYSRKAYINTDGALVFEVEIVNDKGTAEVVVVPL